jgi:hypothetical protein
MSPASLLTEIESVVAEQRSAKAATAETEAPEFYPLDFLDTRERGLSRIFAWLLDPNGSHAQGIRFLSAFTEWLDLDDAWRTELGAAKVVLEAPTSASGHSGFVDILIRIGGRTLAIENKPAAIDQKGQVQRYLSDLASRRLEDFCVLYLSGTGEAPSTTSIASAARSLAVADGRLKIRGYDTLLVWLDTCRNDCRASSVNFMLDGILKHIRKDFGGVADIDETVALTSEICGSEDRLAAALALFEAEATVLDRLTTMLADQVSEAIRPRRGWRVLRADLGRARYSGLIIGLSPNASIGFGIQFDKNNHGALFYGVNVIGGGSLPRGVKAALRDLLAAKGQGTSSWPVWKHFGPNDRFFARARDVDRDFWIAVRDGSLAKMLVVYVEEVERVLRERKLLEAVRSRRLEP